MQELIGRAVVSASVARSRGAEPLSRMTGSSTQPCTTWLTPPLHRAIMLPSRLLSARSLRRLHAARARIWRSNAKAGWGGELLGDSSGCRGRRVAGGGSCLLLLLLLPIA